PGVGAQWSPATRRKTASGHAQWLSWLKENGRLDSSTGPADRVTPERVQRYTDELIATKAPHTVHCRLQELGDALRAMCPERDWKWILRAAGRLRARALPVRNIAARLRSPEEVEKVGLDLMNRAEELSQLSSLKRTGCFRDGLLIALLSRRLLRPRNLAGIT